MLDYRILADFIELFTALFIDPVSLERADSDAQKLKMIILSLERDLDGWVNVCTNRMDGSNSGETSCMCPYLNSTGMCLYIPEAPD